MKREIKGISPVIATVIIVAVAIAVAIAVAYWVTGIIPAFTRYEELKITSAYVDNETHAILNVMNTGSADSTLDNVFVNGRLPLDSFDTIPLKTGDNATLIILSASYDVESFKSGVIYDFNIHSAAGGSYPVSARAP